MVKTDLPAKNKENVARTMGVVSAREQVTVNSYWMLVGVEL